MGPVNNHLSANAHMKKRNIIIGNFLGGLAWGFGTVVGATVVVAILVGLVRSINFVPVVGQFVSGVIDVVQQNQTNPFKKNSD